MELTIKEIHTYNDLVNEGKIDPINFATAGKDSILLPNLDEDGKVYLEDSSQGLKIYPGISTIEKIKEAIDKAQEN